MKAAESVGTKAFLCTHWGEGGKGTEALARHVVEVADSGQSKFKPLYPDEMPLWDKVKTIATEIYRASEIVADASVRNQFKDLQAAGYGHLPVCMAKTQYSFSTDPNLRSAPTGHVVPIRELQAVGRRRVHRRHHRRDHDHAGLAEGAVGQQHPPQREGPDRGAVLRRGQQPAISPIAGRHGRA